MKSTDIAVINEHWDTELPMTRYELRKHLLREICAWARHFRLDVPREYVHTLFWRFRHQLDDIPEEVAAREFPYERDDQYVIGRRDKDEHTLLRRPLLTYHCLRSPAV